LWVVDSADSALAQHPGKGDSAILIIGFKSSVLTTKQYTEKKNGFKVMI
jgi:hypothetical protein